jgi:transcriptional regulator with XRE-family HTH domain
MTSKVIGKLRDAEYRTAFVASQINIGIPFQLRALLKGRGKTQEWLAEKTGMLQPRISGLLNPGKTRPNIETLRRLAEAFDCGLAVRFVPFSELVSWSEEFDPESFYVPGFDDEIGEGSLSESGATSSTLKYSYRPGSATALESILSAYPISAPPGITPAFWKIGADAGLQILQAYHGTVAIPQQYAGPVGAETYALGSYRSRITNIGRFQKRSNKCPRKNPNKPQRLRQPA